MSLTAKRRIGQIWSLLPTKRQRRVILIYHAVGSGPMALPEDSFRRQMEWLSRHAVVESLNELLADEHDNGIRIALTFDDGYRSVYRNAAPVLAEFGFPATVYLNTGHVAEAVREPSQPALGHYRGEEFMLWSEIRELHERGWNIGSHGVAHTDLTLASFDEMERELADSRQMLEERLGEECRHFCYTWGHHDKRVSGLVAKTGYLHAVSARHGALGRYDDQLALPRIDIRKEYDIEDFAAVVCGKWDFLAIIHSLRKRLK